VTDDPPDLQLSLGLRDGRPEAWRSLYDAYAVRVWRAVARRVTSPADVADVVQETFLAAARSARTYDADRGPVWAWLWGIARLHIALHYRKQDQRDRLLQARAALTAVDGQPDLIVIAEQAVLVRAALAELPDDYECLLTARYLDGETVESIARREGSTEVAIRSKLARARQAFRTAYGPPDHPIRNPAP
jgi:RNA polymerase sigma-70 factor (ECF subfamily)